MARVIELLRLSCSFCHTGVGTVWYEVAFLIHIVLIA